MNSQKRPPDDVLWILKKNNVQFIDVFYYAWPEMFGSTAGPRKGIGGQAVTTFTVEAWVCDDLGPTVYICAGMYSFDDSRFEPFKTIDDWKQISIL